MMDFSLAALAMVAVVALARGQSSELEGVIMVKLCMTLVRGVAR